MSIHATYTTARANFAKLWNKVTENHEVVIINRRGSEDVALIAASELASLSETAHLLRSPENAKRLLKALQRAKTKTLKPKKLKTLKKDIGFAEEK